MSISELRALGSVTDVPTAGRALGLSRNAAYQLVVDGQFPGAVLRIGRRYRVPVAGLLAVLGLDPEHE